MQHGIAEETFLAHSAAAKSYAVPTECIPPPAADAALDNVLRKPQDQQSGIRKPFRRRREIPKVMPRMAAIATS